MNLEATLESEVSYERRFTPRNPNESTEAYTPLEETLKAALKTSIGYTDKLLNEMEDWGYFHFKTVFRKLNRLTPLGAASRYLQELYVAVLKTIKS